MPIDFPATPTNGQTFVDGDKTWEYSTSVGAWNLRTQTQTGPTGPTGPVGNRYVSVIETASTSRNITIADENDLIVCTASTTVTLTVLADATESWSLGDQIDILQKGAGRVDVVGTSGVTIQSVGTTSTRTQYSMVGLTKIAANEWLMTGDTGVI